MKKIVFFIGFLALFLVPISINAKNSTAKCVYDWKWGKNSYKFSVNIDYDPNARTGTISLSDIAKTYTTYASGDLQTINFTVNDGTKVKCLSSLFVAYSNASTFKVFTTKEAPEQQLMCSSWGDDCFEAKNSASQSQVNNVAVTSQDSFLTCTHEGNISGERMFKTNMKINQTKKTVVVESVKPSVTTYTFDASSYKLKSYNECPNSVFYKCNLTSGKCVVYSSQERNSFEFRYSSAQTLDADGIGDFKAPNFKFDPTGEVECDDIKELVDWLNTILKFVQYGVIALVIVLCMLDYTKALTASDADALKKANQKVVKRIIIVVALLIVGPVLNFIINLLTDGAVSTCGL